MPEISSLSTDTPPSGKAFPSTVPSDENYHSNLLMQSALLDHLAVKKGSKIDLIFLGDSITEHWKWGQGLPLWNKYYADRAVDFGVGGDRTEHLLWRLDNLPIRDFRPKAAVLMIGTNNWDPASTPESITDGVKAILEKTKELFPVAKIVLVSILPNARANDLMMAANTLIQALADEKSVFWLNLAPKFTPEAGNWKGLQDDKLHLTTLGYEMWAEELNPLLDKIAPKD